MTSEQALRASIHIPTPLLVLFAVVLLGGSCELLYFAYQTTKLL
jgi:hypothetical protein